MNLAKSRSVKDIIIWRRRIQGKINTLEELKKKMVDQWRTIALKEAQIKQTTPKETYLISSPLKKYKLNE